MLWFEWGSFSLEIMGGNDHQKELDAPWFNGLVKTVGLLLLMLNPLSIYSLDSGFYESRAIIGLKNQGVIAGALIKKW